MKRKIAVVLIFVMLLTLTACQRAPKGTDQMFISIDGKAISLVINFDELTITASDALVTVTGVDGSGNVIGTTPPGIRDVYHYTYEDGNITITYPNGAIWWESSTAGGWDDYYDPQRYIEGDVLAMQLNQAYHDAEDRIPLDGRILVGSLFLMIVGAIMAYDPKTVATLRMRWWVKDPEPTEYALRSTRSMGIFFGGMGALILLAAIFL